MTTPDYKLKRKRIANSILAFIFLVFTLLQFNDPDAFVWVSVYGSVTIILVYGIFKPVHRYIVYLLVLCFLVLSATHFAYFNDWLLTNDKTALFGTMVYEKPYLEGTREFLGLLIAIVVLLYQLRVKKNHLNSKKLKK